MTQPLEIKPGDDNYATYFDLWAADGRPRTLERLALGWQYHVIFPNGGDEPTFTLVVSGPLTPRDDDGPPGGMAFAMSTRQSSLPGGQRSLEHAL